MRANISGEKKFGITYGLPRLDSGNGNLIIPLRRTITYHLANGHLAPSSLTFNGIIHPHSRHCFVAAKYRSHDSHMDNLAAAKSAVALPVFLSKSRGVTPFFSLYSSQRDFIVMEQQLPFR
jgi:hypothetical protein